MRFLLLSRVVTGAGSRRELLEILAFAFGYGLIASPDVLGDLYLGYNPGCKMLIPPFSHDGVMQRI